MDQRSNATSAPIDRLLPPLTDEQRRALQGLYQRSPDGAGSLAEFLCRVQVEICGRGAVGLAWCGMYIGVEPDGYTHS
jgi:hypothetical protein